VIQAICRRAFTAKTRVESQAAPYGIVVEKVILKQYSPSEFIFRVLRVFPVSIIPETFHSHLFVTDT